MSDPAFGRDCIEKPFIQKVLDTSQRFSIANLCSTRTDGIINKQLAKQKPKYPFVHPFDSVIAIAIAIEHQFGLGFHSNKRCFQQPNWRKFQQRNLGLHHRQL